MMSNRLIGARIKVLSIFGTRPEVIKLAPVIKELERRNDVFDSKIVVTGQHKEMCDPYLQLFNVTPDFNLSIMQADQTLHSIIMNVLKKLPEVFDQVQPDIVLVQGDTSSAFAAALGAYYGKITVGHVEAGLRTGNKYNPFPEEMNRRLVGVIADLHFAPTEQAKRNLLSEGVASDRIYVTGNTVIDALLMMVKADHEFTDHPLANIDFEKKRVICVTTHRRESFGEPLRNTLRALKRIVQEFSDVEVVLPVHYNPNVRQSVYEMLADTERIHLIDPLPYETFVQLLNKSHLVLTDSGGIQEEAPSLGKPVLVLRETTERPEGIEAGTAQLVGTDPEKIVSMVGKLLRDRSSYHKMATAVNPYGDGTAARRIVDVLQETGPQGNN